MKTLNWSASLLAGAAALGAYLASEVFRGIETRKGVALIHGPLAASGLGLLIYSGVKEKRKDLLAPGALFTVAALGGTYLFTRDVMGKRPQPSITAVHGSAALVAFSLLINRMIPKRTGNRFSLHVSTNRPS